MSYSTRFVKTFKKMFTYKTRAEAEEACKQLNATTMSTAGARTPCLTEKGDTDDVQELS